MKIFKVKEDCRTQFSEDIDHHVMLFDSETAALQYFRDREKDSRLIRLIIEKYSSSENGELVRCGELISYSIYNQAVILKKWIERRKIKLPVCLEVRRTDMDGFNTRCQIFIQGHNVTELMTETCYDVRDKKLLALDRGTIDEHIGESLQRTLYWLAQKAGCQEYFVENYFIDLGKGGEILTKKDYEALPKEKISWEKTVQKTKATAEPSFGKTSIYRMVFNKAFADGIEETEKLFDSKTACMRFLKKLEKDERCVFARVDSMMMNDGSHRFFLFSTIVCYSPYNKTMDLIRFVQKLNRKRPVKLKIVCTDKEKVVGRYKVFVAGKDVTEMISEAYFGTPYDPKGLLLYEDWDWENNGPIDIKNTIQHAVRDRAAFCGYPGLFADKYC